MTAVIALLVVAVKGAEIVGLGWWNDASEQQLRISGYRWKKQRIGKM